MNVVDSGWAILQNLRSHTRTLRKDPWLTAIVVAILGVGIGATTTTFSLVKAVLLEPLRFDNADRLVRLWESSRARGVLQTAVSVPNFRDWQEQQTVFEQMAAAEMATFNLTAGGDPERVAAARITANLLPMLGVRPILGRDFLAEEERPGSSSVALLGYRLWQRRFGGDRSLVGQSVQLNGESFTVVGILPEDIDFPGARDLWVPLVIDAAKEPWRADRTNRNLAVFARLRAGVTVERASAEMNQLAHRLEEAYFTTNDSWGVRLLTFYDWIVPEPIRRATAVLLGAVGLLLLLACTNVANLLLASAVARRREIATHIALGAGRARLVRHLLCESLLLAAMGGMAGCVLTQWGTRLLGSVTIPEIARLQEVSVDSDVLAFALVVSTITGLAFGIVPAWWASEPNPVELLKSGGRSGTSGSTYRLRGMLVAAQVGLTVVVLICAGLLIRSFLEIRHVPLGFSTENVLTFQLNLPASKYRRPDQRVYFYDRLLDQLRAIPGVIEAGGTTHPPYSVSDWRVDVILEGSGRTPSQRAGSISAEARAVTPGYFATAGIEIRRGRPFADADRLLSEPPLIVNEAFAHRYWPDEDPVGKRLRPGRDSRFGTVVGVVADARSRYEEEPEPALYFAYSNIGMPSLAIALHTSTAAERFVPGVRSALHTLDPAQPIYNVRTVDQIVTNATAQPRLQTVVVGLVAAAAVVLAAFGTYSMIAYAVLQQKQEIAVRMALGAAKRHILTTLIGQCMAYIAPGVGAGLAASFALARLMKSVLFRIATTDALTFTVVPLLVIGIALLACYLPAQRAAIASPSTYLRHE